MGASESKIIENEILLILRKHSLDTYNQGINDLENYVITLKGKFDKDEILIFLMSIYENLGEEYEQEIIGDVMNRIHGFCHPGSEIEWPDRKKDVNDIGYQND